VEYRRSGSAASVLSQGDLTAALGVGARCLHLTGITPALSVSARETTVAAARTARQAGALVCLDVNYRSRLWSREDASAALRELVEHADVVVASDDELPLLAATRGGDHDEDAAVADLLAAGTQLVAVKRGAAGATVVTRDGTHDVPARAVAGDPTGAGDAFAVAYLASRADGHRPLSAARRATALVGALLAGLEAPAAGGRSR
jgi:2-dehydro-3-deoxygluconokinase